MLELKKISKKFYTKIEEINALKEVNLTLTAGEFMVIRGPSGCGKTTLLMVAGCLLNPSSGQVLVNNLDPYNLPSNQVNQLRSETIGFVFQQFHLIPYLTVRDNIISPLLATGKPGVSGRPDDLIRQFGLEERAGHLPYQLSTGEKQRTALARALYNKPEIIMADEPTGNLDEKNASVIYSYLKQYVTDGGCVFLVSHDNLACDYATQVMNMDKGRIEST